MAILALLVVPALILDDRTTNPMIRTLCDSVNWFVWVAFAAEFAVGLTVATNRRGYLRHSWFELTIILLSPPFLVPDALQTTRGLRALRVLRLVRIMRGAAVATIGLRTTRRLLRHRGFHYVLLVALAMVALGAAGIYLVEKGETIRSFGDALWWSVVTVTTVGYGDVSPRTVEGRLIAVSLMIIGIGVISALTATIASFFVGEEREREFDALEARLKQVELKLDQLLRLARKG
jgi:voltage-gated potassium channel